MASLANIDTDVARYPLMAAAAASSRKHSVSSTDDGWQGTVAPSTPATSVYSEDLEAEQERHAKAAELTVRTRQTTSHWATVIHEEAEWADWAMPSSSPLDERAPARDDAGGGGGCGGGGGDKLRCTVLVTTTALDRPAEEMDSPTLPASPAPPRVLQPVEYDLPYTHPDMPWDKFYSSRATYPRSMFDTVLSYHRGPLDVVHDLGAGSGLAADGLLSAIAARQSRTASSNDNDNNNNKANSRPRELPRTILSDPGEENLGIAARFLAARQPGARLECWRACGEEQHTFLAPSAVDMTICAEALHWMDMPSAVGQAAQSLRPGATFAVVLYSCFPRILNNGRAKKVLRALVEDHLRNRLLTDPDDDEEEEEQDENQSDEENNNHKHPRQQRSPGSPSAARVRPNWQRGMKALAYGLDAVELPADQWEDIKRFEINCGATGWWWPAACKDMLGCAIPMADASPHERYVYEDYDDWGRVASLRELKDLLLSIQVGFGDKTWEGPLWRELESLVRGPLHLVWQVHMILARRKGPGLDTVPEEDS